MRTESGPAEITEDAVLGGRLRLRQPRRGHRVGHDAILLAAATGVRAGEHVVELGAGVGAAGLALALRCPEAAVTLVEIEPELVRLAQDNIVRNGIANARALALDACGPAATMAATGLPAGCAARVLMNPPFRDAALHQPSPDHARRRAHLAYADTLTGWTRTARRLLAPSGVLTLIWPADGLLALLQALDRGFGGVTILPVHPRPDAAAIRVLARAVKDSRAPHAIAPALVLNDASGRPSAQAEALLRAGATLPMAAW